MHTKIFSLPIHAPKLSRESKLHDEQHKGHEVYTGLGHQCGVIPYSSEVWWIASCAEDEQVQGKNSLLRRGVLGIDELVWLRMEWIRSKMSCLLLWWIVLFIEALVLFPNLGGKGSNNGQI